MTAQARLLGGRYQVGELLGYGGMAEVHQGRDLRLGRDVAIKMLRTDLARDETFQLRFRREAQNAASLNHPAIVAVYDTGEETGPNGENLPYIVMEFVNGRTLKEVLVAEGRLQPRRALEITADICAALEFSHRHQIIHRDIKPGNVMLTQTGQVKVMDFGIARALAAGTSTMTQTSAVIGTAQYLSPEQARGETVDARSDVYATGCLLYELLTGQPPFTGDNPVSVAYQHVREDPRPPSVLNPDVTPEIDAVVLKALAKNPLNRYQSTGEMRADLLRAASGQTVEATPVLSDADRTAFLGPVAGGSSAAGVADPRRRRAATWVIVSLILLALLAAAALGTGIWLANRKETVTVPELRGKTQSQAQQDAEHAGLRFALGAPVFNQDCVKGQVVDQSPTAGTKVGRGETVSVSVCGGKEQVKVPSLANYPKAAAVTILGQAGLKATFVQVDSQQPVDTVVSTDPPAGTSVDKGSTVTVNISKGNLVQVPSVIGLPAAQASQQLRDAGFKVETATVDEGKESGTVVRTSPDAGSVAKRGDTVTIFVQKNAATPSPSPTTASPSPPPASPPPAPSPSISTVPVPGG